MKYYILILLMSLFQVIKGDIKKAYGLYLTGEYDSAYSCYKAEHDKNSENLEAVYGMINCHIAKRNYNLAIDIINDATDKQRSSILFLKAYLHLWKKK